MNSSKVVRKVVSRWVAVANTRRTFDRVEARVAAVDGHLRASNAYRRERDYSKSLEHQNAANRLLVEVKQLLAQHPSQKA